MCAETESRGDASEWECSAYGAKASAMPMARCFFAEPGRRECASSTECVERMSQERKRAFRRLQELAASGDPTWVEIESFFASPEDMLNADDETGGSEADDDEER